MSQVVMAGRCNWCSRQLPPSSLLMLGTRQAMCLKCYEWHAHALRVLSGEMPRGCQECGLQMAALNALTAAATIRMYVVPKDGVYQVLCVTCKDSYCRQRADLYQHTRFGQELKLG